MNLVSVRLITDDVDRLVAFYESVTGLSADRPAPVFAELRTPNGTIAIGHSSTAELFGPGSVRAAENRSAIVELLVDDVDAAFDSVRTRGVEVVQEPTTMPWGNRSLLLRDPDGTLVNLFAPVTQQAIEKFAAFRR
ncbi:VOC family protein [Humibacter ginsenosidimutans]|uniref:VOC family protein n=1 Tax=Humibacter ginsenosidimutans TaxID=2599293 RepID=A0A5B8M393_9MICO|nr:VOC family protein [Humibacter ginsenosidimutans]QDZ14813.1 VOC family protein [Humibacter ginsenosidimutans]